ncbi:MAG: chemotaxis response regulator protein-glutamate methylesterase [Coriobacteriia bacterium]|nr:chemotaxis response regulator protein-glutamate methylesterase [Coriobacteriia bacterium]
MPRRTIGVLIVDDSAVVRATLRRIFEEAPDIEVIGVANDPYVAVQKMRLRTPDVIVLDIEMPRMDGLTFLQRIMAQHPLPVVICSAHVGEGSENAVRALEYGAVEIIAKPSARPSDLRGEAAEQVLEAVRAAAHVRVDRVVSQLRRPLPALTVDAMIAARSPVPRASRGAPVIVMGASTGGTEALRAVLAQMPADSPGIVIVQHMPERFTAAFAARLDACSPLAVREASDGDRVLPGVALVAPGGRHTYLKRSVRGVSVAVAEGPPVNRHRPSVDVLFRSAAQEVGSDAVGVLMTGMGEDGAQGLLEIREAGGFTIAQDEETAVVWGMPGAAVERGAALRVLPLEAIATAVQEAVVERLAKKGREARLRSEG